MRIIIHAGMHKTGTSSIQDFLSKSNSTEFSYARYESSNNCGLFILLFEDLEKLGAYHGFRARGEKYVASLPELREIWLGRLTDDLNASVEKTFIISAEDISWPSYLPAVRRMKEFLERWTSDIEVIGYLRSPRSFAISAFQQILKDGGTNEFNLKSLWPHYRARFSGLDEVFGADRVRLRKYDGKLFRNGDIICDFFDQIGLDLLESPGERSNQTLSAEATALLYVQRRFGDGYLRGFPAAQRGNNAFVEALSSIGQGRFSFSEWAWGQVVEANFNDLKWAEERLGVSLIDADVSGAVPIGTEEDLVKLALANYQSLEEVLEKAIKSSDRPPIERTARTLDLLRKFCY